jgi:hypothetical protein
VRFRRHVAPLLAGLLLCQTLGYAGPLEDRARQVSALLEPEDPHEEHTRGGALSASRQASLLALLGQLTPLQRFRVFRILDRTQETDLRSIHDRLDGAGKRGLLQLCRESGDAATAAGLQQMGIISDLDNTAFPLNYGPDGADRYADAGKVYRELALGTDGKGDPSNVHYVSARPSVVTPQSRIRLERAGLPPGTFDTRESIMGILTGGLDDQERSKVANINLWVALHPGQRFMLIGDTDERDPEVYATILARHPEAVAGIMIHEVGGAHRDPARFPGETFFNSYAQVDRILREKGVLTKDATLPSNVAFPIAGATPPGTRETGPDLSVRTRVGGYLRDAVGLGIEEALRKIGR